MGLKKKNVNMEPIIDLIWNPEEDLEITPDMMTNCLNPHCAVIFSPNATCRPDPPPLSLSC